MPLIQSKNSKRASPMLVSVKQPFWTFPAGGHLLITTPRRVFAWDSTGLRTVFRCSRDGIAAAREAEDGSGILAIASQNVVILHDTKEKHERSWKLSADLDSVRHIEYSRDAKSLFFSTCLDNAIQRYCLDKARLGNAVRLDSSPIVALALSSSGDLLLSASAGSSIVHLTNLARSSEPISIDPQIAGAKVSLAVSHPDRPNVFLLAFDEGTVIAFDVRKFLRESSVIHSDLNCSSYGEIGRFARLYRHGDNDFKMLQTGPISGAAFLPRFKSRAITVGHDGRCRLVDFSNGGVILRTWQAGAPITSVAVVRNKHQSPLSAEDAAPVHSRYEKLVHSIEEHPSPPTSLIVGRSDGMLDIYSSVGLLLGQQKICHGNERILSVAWVEGPSPRPLYDDRSQQRNKASPTANPLVTPSSDESTVRHVPSKDHTESQAAHISDVGYEDLFSPVKPIDSPVLGPQERRYMSPTRLRPRISSRTFMTSPKTRPISARSDVIESKNNTASPSGKHKLSLELATSRHITSPPIKFEPAHRHNAFRSPRSAGKRRITFRSVDNGSVRPKNPPAISRTSQLLSDLRRMRGDDPSSRQRGTLAHYSAPQHPHIQSRTSNTHSMTAAPTVPPTPLAVAASHQPPPKHQSYRPVIPPTSSSSINFEEGEKDEGEDIWLTSESEPELRPNRRHRALHLSHQITDNPSKSPASLSPFRNSSSRRSPNKPSREALLLSSRKRPESTLRNFVPKNPAARLSDVRVPVMMMRARTDRWVRVLPTRGELGRVPAIEGDDDDENAEGEEEEKAEEAEEGGEGRVGKREGKEYMCSGKTRTRMRELEGEVAKLKSEVLALKAVVRRNGLVLPACLR